MMSAKIFVGIGRRHDRLGDGDGPRKSGAEGQRALHRAQVEKSSEGYWNVQVHDRHAETGTFYPNVSQELVKRWARI